MAYVECDGDGHVIALDDPVLYTSDRKASALQGLANLHQLTYLSLMASIPVVSLPEQLSQLQKLQSLYAASLCHAPSLLLFSSLFMFTLPILGFDISPSQQFPCSVLFPCLPLALLCPLLFSAPCSSLPLALLCPLLFSAPCSSLPLALLCPLLFSAPCSSLLLAPPCSVLFPAPRLLTAPCLLLRASRLHASDIKGNNFSGSIPEAISSLKQLRKLRITELTLSGSIPESIGALTNLQDLDLEGCGSLDGTIPASIGNLTALTSLDLQNSMLNGTIPAGIGHLTALYTLLHSRGNQQPQAAGGVVSGDGVGMQGAVGELKDNSLCGTIPACITHLTALITLYAHSLSTLFLSMPFFHLHLSAKHGEFERVGGMRIGIGGMVGKEGNQ
ncbi:unnamed protein product [Closterium sp. NIES-64]|nr:unnamed protein product [Closterium sp. NIES-64]